MPLPRPLPERSPLPRAFRVASLGILLAWSLASAAPRADDALQRARAFDREALASLFDRYYELGKTYYRNGWRREAVWCLKRSVELRPELGQLARFVRDLQDFENPMWRRTRWRSPREAVDKAFRSKAEALDTKYVALMLKLGSKHGASDEPGMQDHAHGWFLRALQLRGGPFHVDRRGLLDLGKAGEVPAEMSKRLLAEDLVSINGDLWLRDSMLRSIPDVRAVVEARSDHCLVRVLTRPERASELLAAMDQAYAAFVASEGGEPGRLLGLFVFPDEASYRDYCMAQGLPGHAAATGFATPGEGFAVTYEHETVVKTAVHEAAHLYHAYVYETSMPSWYDEGFACWFGHQDSMTWDGKTLRTELPPDASSVAPLLGPAGLALPLATFLGGDALAEIGKGSAAGGHFYLQSWAFLHFLRGLDDRTLRPRFEEWESFCLGSGYARGSVTAAALWDRLLTPEQERLEEEFVRWLLERPAEGR